jgi:RHS repeat-associated protein
LSDSNGQPVWQWAITGFGELEPTMAQTGWIRERLGTAGQISNTTAVSFNLRYPGQQFDSETGLFYNHHRTYDPYLTVGYTEADPLGLAAGWNRFGYANGNPLLYSDESGLSPLKVIALCAKGYRVIKTVGFKEAVRAARRGENVLANSHAQAKQIARSAGNGKRPIRDPAHKPEEGQLPHYHPNPRNGGHIFYSIISGVTVSNYLQCEDSETPCIEGTLGQVIDIFNPLSIGQDIVDIIDSGEN